MGRLGLDGVRRRNDALVMSTRSAKTRRLLALACLATAAATCLLGCQAQQPRATGPKPMLRGSGTAKPADENAIDPTAIETRDDIVRIVQFWPQAPWLFDNDRVIGFKATIYFVAGETMKGAFVPRSILVWVYEAAPGSRRKDDRKLVYMWEFDPAEAMGYRVNRRSLMGYHYGFPLRWPEVLDLEDKLIEFQFGYERANKRVVLSSPKRFRVPVPHGYEPPRPELEE